MWRNFKTLIAAAAVFTSLAIITGCEKNADLLSKNELDERDSERQADLAETTVCFKDMDILTKAADPDEQLISDVNFIITDEFGDIERVEYFNKTPNGKYRLKVVKGRSFSLYACCNFGFRINVRTLDQLKNLCCYLAYPDDYRMGIPMCGTAENIAAGDDVRIELTRLMAKIMLRMDRSHLESGVEMNVSSVKIGNCPKRAAVFADHFGLDSTLDEDWFFASGFTRKGTECAPLNLNEGGRSGAVILYMLENPKPENTWIELCMDYRSSKWFSGDNGLVYRFLTGDGNGSAVERNCCYSITVKPTGDGLGKEGWSVDKSDLSTQTRFSMKPDGYIEVDVGDRIHVRCDCYPEYAQVEFNQENLENDRETGIYEYRIDEDGKGVVLDIVGYGAGMVYAEVGEPVNDAGLLYIHVRDDRQ